MPLLQLVDFLKPKHIQKEWEGWICEMPYSFSIFIDSKEYTGEMIGWEYSEQSKGLHEEVYLFDDYLQRELDANIAVFATQINELKLDPRNSKTVASDKVFNKVIARHKDKLKSRHDKLKSLGIPIERTLEKLNFLIDSLSKQTIKSKNKNDIIQGNRSEDANAILSSLFDWLVLKAKVDKDAKHEFVRFFTSSSIFIKEIRWHGEPKELVALKYSLLNPIDGENPILTTKVSQTDMFKFFQVMENNRRVKYHKDYNSNPRGGSFYKSIIIKLDTLT